MKDQKSVYVPKEWEFEGQIHNVGRMIPISELTEEEIEICKKHYLKLMDSLPNEVRDFIFKTNSNNLSSLIDEYVEKANNLEQGMKSETSAEVLRITKNQWLLYGEFILKLKQLMK